ncbi:exosortase/archaeosortase family protein [Thermococcus camini]|uniref:Exosortase/archaeosortase family protein n=1 Tax=Thermococcus camini TaxID=2016373 RepID=A0A7G2D4X0_9EURY|nr:exosortase/archaeosortase family protein [Thermococcus camini]CAD5243316.1 conserved membrane protein of unknown function [Thermococcus camini]
MRRSEGFLIFSLALTGALFAITRTPPVLYFGLIYAIITFTIRERLEPREPSWKDPVIWTGAFLVGISPVFMIFKWGPDPSPSTFQALLLIGVSIILFKVRTVIIPISVAGIEVALAALTRSDIGVNILDRSSNLFVDATSHLVRGLIYLFDVPIAMNGNVAVVRNSVVIIGSGCSGLDAFVLYLLASLLLIYLRKSRGREAALLLLGALGIIPLNAVRIFTLLVIGYHSGISFLELFHSHLGDLMFVAYVFLYWWWVIKHRGKESSDKN